MALQPQKIKAAFFDIDGTLLSFESHRLSEGTVKALEQLRRMGVRTFISSGRPEILIPEMPVVFDGYITMNGGYVFAGSELLVDSPIPQAESQRWLRFAEEHDLCTMLFTAHGMAVNKITPEAQALRDQLEFTMPPLTPIEQLAQSKIYQIIALMPPEMDAEVARMLPACRLPRWHNVFTDIVCSANSKAVGMDCICRRFGIDQSETIAFGDGGNDIEMLRWAGIGVAMGNAADKVKRHADYVTTDVDHEGIAQALQGLLFSPTPEAAEQLRLRRTMHNYEELLTDCSDDPAYIARGNGFADAKYSEEFIENQIDSLNSQIAAVTPSPSTPYIG
ncbi:MAG: Cof-type HAD-IIB family hydrolase [Bacteroidales bacterium]|nr:Cof-type HAD-IIB family hydrolase [Bacteroidales bacterium]